MILFIVHQGRKYIKKMSQCCVPSYPFPSTTALTSVDGYKDVGQVQLVKCLGALLIQNGMGTSQDDYLITVPSQSCTLDMQSA